MLGNQAYNMCWVMSSVLSIYHEVLIMNQVVFHMKGVNNTEYDIIKDDIPYSVINGVYEDPDVQICEHYGIDYDQVNCIELLS